MPNLPPPLFGRPRRPRLRRYRHSGKVGFGVVIVTLALAAVSQWLPPEMPAPGAPLIGRARVIDGDTLDIDGTRIRLFGIDAPEKAQKCRDRNARPYGCGIWSMNALQGRIDGQTLVCERRDTDGYGRTVAVCRQGDTDINRWMVETGWAIAYRQYSNAYVEAEESARQETRGLWAGSFVPPAQWRHHHRR